ncbi:acyl-CoA thioesterase [Paraburkholderia phymatum]|uniref:Acyl-CoA thioesterase n=1 Tax=Paraburkholderia phymatum TaxID=148447 RepID=A0ACC6TYJ0_9BURK
MNFHTRKWVKPEDLNPNGTLFGGSLLRWIDEEAAIYAICQLDNQRVVTKFMSELNFVSSARQGDIIELGMTATHFGRSSITLRCEVRNKITRKSILTVEKMVFVNLDENGNPAPHGRKKIRYADEAFERYSGKLRAMQQQPSMLAASDDADAIDAVDQEADAAH